MHFAVIRCPALPKPLNGRKSENRYWPGTIVRFSCNDGYRLVGYEVRRCREDGLWSWGYDPQCIEVLRYNATVMGIVLAFVVPSLILLFLGLFLLKREKDLIAKTR